MITAVQRGTWSELTVTCPKSFADPVRDVEIIGTFTSPSGTSKTILGFWDGGNTWRIRAETLEAGEWTYSLSCGGGCCGSEDNKGTFTVVETPKAPGTLFGRGGLAPKAKGHRLQYADGTPFFWMADTAWNGVLKAKPADWDSYLEARRNQGFTAVQCVLTQWRAFPHDEAGNKAFDGTEGIRINPDFFKGLDARVDAINRHGLVAALVVLWSCTAKDIGNYLPEEDLLLLARYIVARYGCHQVVWFLGGDGNYMGDNAAKWVRMGRTLFGEGAPTERRLVTMHPGGQHWVADEFRNEDWFDFIGYQSGHGDSDEFNSWLVYGKPGKEWTKGPKRPVIDLEPCYEGHKSYNSGEFISARKARRSLYWNLLITPCAGVTYGNHGVWPWVEQREVPMDHGGSGETDPWHQVLWSEGAVSVALLRRFFDGLEWWKLVPNQKLVTAEADPSAANSFIAAATSEDGGFGVVYLPLGGSVTIRTGELSNPSEARWYNPRIGTWSGAVPLTGEEATVQAPAGDDWVLLVK